MQIVPAPGRQFKSFSMILGLFIGSFNALALLLQVVGSAHVLSAQTVLLINGVLAFLIVPAKLLQQQLAVTTDQKIAIIAAAASLPMAEGHADVQTQVDGSTLPAAPQPAIVLPTIDGVK